MEALSESQKFSVIMIDPPWPQRKGNVRKVRPNQARELDYRTMPVNLIFQLLDRDIFSVAETQHTIFIWAVDKFLRQCEQEMDLRGYKLHARIIWDKGNGVAPAFTVRFSHEYLLWYYIPGSFMPIAKEVRGKYTTVIHEKSREHSRKPVAAYEMISAFYPETEKLDVFSRESYKGWHQYGDEIDKFD